MSERIFIDMNILSDYCLTGDAFSVYYAIRKLNPKNRCEYVNLNMLSYLLYRRKANRNERDSLKKGLKELVRKNLIDEYYRFGEFDCIYDLNKTLFDNNSERFTYVYGEDMDKIMELDISSRGSIAIFYSWIMYSMLKKGVNEKYLFKISVEMREILTARSNISPQTASKYIEILNQNRIIYTRRCFNLNILSSNGRYMTVKNIYSRYEDRELCDSFINEKNGHIVSGSRYVYANEMRSALQRYEWMKRGKKYPEDEVEMIYEMVKEWNDEKKREYIEGKIGKLVLKDLSIFKKYGLEEKNV